MNLIDELEKMHADAKKGPNSFIKREHYFNPDMNEEQMERIVGALKSYDARVQLLEGLYRHTHTKGQIDRVAHVG